MQKLKTKLKNESKKNIDADDCESPLKFETQMARRSTGSLHSERNTYNYRFPDQTYRTSEGALKHAPQKRGKGADSLILVALQTSA